MESNKRTLAKALSWQMLGLLAMSLIGYWFTGSFLQGGSIALASAVTGMLCYVLHERAWNRVAWGRGQAAHVGPSQPPPAEYPLARHGSGYEPSWP